MTSFNRIKEQAVVPRAGALHESEGKVVFVAHAFGLAFLQIRNVLAFAWLSLESSIGHDFDFDRRICYAG